MYTFKKNPFPGLIICFIILTAFIPLSAGTVVFLNNISETKTSIIKNFQEENNVVSDIKQLNKSLQNLLTAGKYEQSLNVVNLLIPKISNTIIQDTNTLSESYYLIGVYFSIANNNFESIEYLNQFVALKEVNNELDGSYAKALYNIGVAYYGLGDFSKHEDFTLRSLDIERDLKGEKSADLLRTYLSLIIAYLELQEYDKAQTISIIALEIVDKNIETVNLYDLINFYNNLGVLFTRLADYTKAKLYLDKAESIYKSHNLPEDDNYINLANSLAITYDALRQVDKSNEYYEQGIALALSRNSSLAFNIINSYAIFLADNGNEIRGDALLFDALERAKTKFGNDSRNYYEVLNNYANYLREYKIDNNRSIQYYQSCLDYLSKNTNDVLLTNSVYIGYSLSLAESGEPYKALETIQSLIFSEYSEDMNSGIYYNPDIVTIKADRKTLNVFKTKYKIIWDIYKKSHNQKALESASETSGIIVTLLEKVRINISEEESRLILGTEYRDSYLNSIRDFNLLYINTGDQHYLEKAFEFSEKSKVAGLLTSTRELKATQFHIPQDIANYERKLQRDISIFNDRIGVESEHEKPDAQLINNWKDNLLETTRLRDSLIQVFEQQYPEYYAIKYNTHVASLGDIPGITGRNGNYLNYVISDTIGYIFVANRKHQQLLTIPIDSSFFNNIVEFRNLLSTRPPSNNARTAFEKYQIVGYGIYDILINPIKQYLISNKIIISPDNILSYLPFETLPTSPDSGKGILYRNLAYLMNEYDVSYTYSATFMAESIKRVQSKRNKVIAFAPKYYGTIYIDSILKNRQTKSNVLTDLPYAKVEAEYVAKITGGELYTNNEARESVFKAECSKFDIIHLAMHTVVNDIEPMYSTLIFSPEIDSTQDRYLKTYEIYGIPLKAKMVVLSSCNTGTGFLFSGEGILSLARGFIYSGSESVIMSMWEVEDRSGTEIIKGFYDNLIRGKSKSSALRRSRLAYLSKADQMRSHPYFWATLIIYGDNSPLYYPKTLIIISVLIVLLLAVLTALYFRKRKYS